MQSFHPPVLLACLTAAGLLWACGSSGAHDAAPSAANDPGAGDGAFGGSGSSGGGGAGQGGTSGPGNGSGTGAGGGAGSSSGGASGGSSSGAGNTGSGSGVTPPGGGGYTSSGPVDFGPNVLVFDPSMGDSTIQTKLDAVYDGQETNQFGAQRYAYFFKPGKYNLDVQLGFYMEAVGLGAAPDDVSITGAVRSMAKWNAGNATDNFWRLAANLSVTPLASINVNDVWAVSQATALRRFHVVSGGANLFDPEGGPNEWASGGRRLEDRRHRRLGSQQQATRNVNMGQWVGGVWNMVFVGDDGDPTGTWPKSPYTFVSTTPTIREKPYLILDASGSYAVVAPTMAQATQGTTWESGTAAATTTPIDKFYIAHAETDTAATINTALTAGANLILTPGVYHLASALQVTRPGTIVLGLGLATLTPDQGTAALTVADVDSVTIAGILFDAGPMKSPTLLQIGDAVTGTSHALSPTALFDVSSSGRRGGRRTTTSCVTIIC